MRVVLAADPRVEKAAVNLVSEYAVMRLWMAVAAPDAGEELAASRRGSQRRRRASPAVDWRERGARGERRGAGLASGGRVWRARASDWR